MSKWIKDLSTKPDTSNLMVKEVENKHECNATGDKSLYRTPIVQTLKSTNNKWGVIKMPSFCKERTPLIG